MKIRLILIAAAVSLTLTGCGCFDKYESKGSIPADAYGNDVKLTETSLAQMSWREFFTDPLLQQLIDSVLARNTDINSVRIAVEKSEASLKAAKLAYLPSLYFSPQGTLSSFDYGPVSKTYNLPLQLSLDIDAFGSITNQKRKSQAVLMQSKIREESLRANLVSTVAQQYFMLQLLDRQLQILTATDSLWNASLETEKTLWENGKIYSTAVNQMESSYLNVKTQIVDTRRNIRSVENAICRLLAQTPQHINRSAWGSSLHHLFRPCCLRTVPTSVWPTTPWRKPSITHRWPARPSSQASRFRELPDGPTVPVPWLIPARYCSTPWHRSPSPSLPVAG